MVRNPITITLNKSALFGHGYFYCEPFSLAYNFIPVLGEGFDLGKKQVGSGLFLELYLF